MAEKILVVSHWWFVWFDWFDSIVRFGRMFRWNIWRTSWWTPWWASWRWWWIVSLHHQRLTRSTIHMSEWCSRSSWRRWYVDPILKIVRCTRLCTAQIHGRPSIRLNRWCSWCRWRYIQTRTMSRCWSRLFYSCDIFKFGWWWIWIDRKHKYLCTNRVPTDCFSDDLQYWLS